MFSEKCLAYSQLMRIHRPVGFLLLWFPAAWGLWAAAGGRPAWQLLLYFVLGTLCMRSAGCVINDMADRNIDGHVQRTASRPLAEQRVSLREAGLILLLLLALALLILWQLPAACLQYALLALGLTLVYPFCKRYISAPQLVLGLAFSMAIPMAYAATAKALDWHCLGLLVINSLWVLSYDTMYAMVDREDDRKIGVHSTAIYFASWDRLLIGIFQSTMHLLWLLLFWPQFDSAYGLVLWLAGALILLYQQTLIHGRDPKACFQAFNASVYYGFWTCLALYGL